MSAAAAISSNRDLIERVLPRRQRQTFRYPADARIVLGKAFALDDQTFVAYPDCAFPTMQKAIAHLFALLDSAEPQLLPSFLVDLGEKQPQARRLRYGDGAVSVGQSRADTLPLARLTSESLRRLVGDLPPLSGVA